jgi:hypothetical protein
MSHQEPEYNKKLDFLWALFAFFWLKNQPKQAYELAATLYEQPFDFPNKLEADIVDFSYNHDEKILEKLALSVIDEYEFSVEKHIVLVALLVEKKLLSINEAALQLDYFGVESTPHLQIQQVLDVAWLVNEDRNDNFMQPDKDDLLSEALQAVLQVVESLINDAQLRF